MRARKPAPKPMRNAVPLPVDFGDWLFLVRQAVAMEAAFQEGRVLSGSDRFFASNKETRRAFWVGAMATNAGLHSPMFLTQDLNGKATARKRQAERDAAIARQTRLDAHRLERKAGIAAGKFIQALGRINPSRTMPCIGDPEFRAGFMRRHGLDFTATEQTA